MAKKLIGVNANHLFTQCVKIPAWKPKMQGYSVPTGAPLDFTPEEKKKIKTALKQLFKEAEKSL